MPGPGFKIADGYVEIHADVDRGELQRGIEAAVASISKAARTVNLFGDFDKAALAANASSAISKIPKAARTVRLFFDFNLTEIISDVYSALAKIPREARTLELLVDIDVFELARKIELAIRMIPAAARTITLNIDIDMGAALAQLAALRGLLAGLGGGGGFGGLSSGASSSAASLGSLAGVIPIVTIGATALFAALTVMPSAIGLVIASVGGLSAGIVGMAGVAAVAILGLKGMTDALKEAATTGKVSAESLKGLTPAARSFVLALTPVHGLIERFAKIAQQNLFAGLDKALAYAIQSWGVLGPFIGEVATGLGRVAKETLAALGATRNMELIATIFSAMGRALTTVAPIIPMFMNSFLRIAESALPVLTALSDKVRQLGANFHAWVRTADEDGRLDKLFMTAMREAKGLLDVLGGILIVGAKFAKVLFPGVENGQASMAGLVAKLDEISAWLDSPENVARIRAWINGFLGFGRAALDAAGSVINAFDSIVGFFQEHEELFIGVLAGMAAAALLYAGSMGIAAAATIAATWPILAAVAAAAALAAAGTWLYRNWSPFRTLVDGVVEGLRKQAGALVQMAGIVYNAWQTLWDAFGNARDFLGGVVEAIENFVTRIPEFLGGVVESAEGFFARLVAYLATVPEKIGAIIDPIEARIAAFTTSVVTWFTELPGRIGAALAAAPGVISNAFTVGLLAILDFVAYWTGYATGLFVRFLLELPATIMGYATGLWSTITTVFTVARDSATALAAQTYTNVVAWFQALPGNVAAGLSTLWGVVTTAFVAARDAAYNLAASTVEGVRSFFAELPGRAAGAVSNLWGAISGAFFGARDQAHSAASNTVNTVAGTLSSLPDRAGAALSGFAGRVGDALSSAVGRAASIGGDIISGLINGINGAAGRLMDLARRLAGQFLAGFQAALGINSPSTVMAKEVGRWIPPGIVKGAEDAMPDAQRSLASSTNGLVSAARGLVPGAGSSTTTTTTHTSHAPTFHLHVDASQLRTQQEFDDLFRGIERNARRFTASRPVVASGVRS